jgi:hypothetical protein
LATYDPAKPQPYPRPDWTYWGRPSSRNEDEREERYQAYLEHSASYFAAVEANGGQPWFNSEDERRELFYRRYTQPRPPAGLTIPNITKERAA